MTLQRSLAYARLVHGAVMSRLMNLPYAEELRRIAVVALAIALGAAAGIVRSYTRSLPRRVRAEWWKRVRQEAMSSLERWEFALGCVGIVVGLLLPESEGGWLRSLLAWFTFALAVIALGHVAFGFGTRLVTTPYELHKNAERRRRAKLAELRKTLTSFTAVRPALKATAAHRRDYPEFSDVGRGAAAELVVLQLRLEKPDTTVREVSIVTGPIRGPEAARVPGAIAPWIVGSDLRFTTVKQRLEHAGEAAEVLLVACDGDVVVYAPATDGEHLRHLAHPANRDRRETLPLALRVDVLGLDLKAVYKLDVKRDGAKLIPSLRPLKS